MPALIFMYHDLSGNCHHIPPGHRPYVLEPSIFRDQMHAVTAQGFPALTVSQWCVSPRWQRAIVLTFDDGHVSNYDQALPILLEYQLKATFFITAGQIGTGETMSWEQIRVLHAAGMEIGSHTVTHRPPSTLDDKDLRYELFESRRILEDGLGAPVTSISSPTGFFNARMRDIAREVGYRALCIGRVGVAADDGDPFTLNRVAVKRTMSQPQFEALLRYDRIAIGSLRTKQWARDMARSIIGRAGYLRFRKILLNRLGDVQIWILSISIWFPKTSSKLLWHAKKKS